MNRYFLSCRNAAAALIIGALTITLTACGNKQAAAAAKPRDEALSVGTESVYRVEPARLATGPLISGSLEAEKEATVAAEVPGAVLSTSAEEGQPVTAGTLLARIDDSALRESVLSAQSAVRSADQQVTVAKRNAERAEALLKGGAIAERDAEVARWNVTNGQAALADARSRLTYAREQLAKTAVHAPFRGVVSKKSVAPGDTVQPGTPLYTIVDPTRMRLVAHVPAEGIVGLQIGTPVDFVVAGAARPSPAPCSASTLWPTRRRGRWRSTSRCPTRAAASSPASTPRAASPPPCTRRSPCPPRPSTAR